MIEYFNLVCEEVSLFGGKVIHIDENIPNMEAVHKTVKENYKKYPNAKWELYPFTIQSQND